MIEERQNGYPKSTKNCNSSGIKRWLANKGWISNRRL